MNKIFVYDRKITSLNFTKENLQRVKNKKVWIDLISPTKDELKILRETYKLHPLTTEDIFVKNTRVKIEIFPNYLFIIFYGLYKNKKIEVKERDFIIGKKFLISSRLDETENIRELKKNSEKLQKLMEKGMDFLLHKMIDYEIDNFFPALEDIDAQIDAIERKIIQKPEPRLLSKTIELKRTLVSIKKIVLPQRDKIALLAKSDLEFISPKAVVYFRDIYDHAVRVADTIDNYREATGSVFEVYMSSVSNNMNEIMKVLSIIATIMLPLTLIAGIYGMNFIAMPGLKSSNGFWAVILSMAILTILMVSYFRRKRWI